MTGAPCAQILPQAPQPIHASVATLGFPSQCCSFSVLFFNLSKCGIECTQFIFVIISHTEYSPYYANVRSLLYTYYYKSALLSTVFLVSFFSPQILCTGAASNISFCTSVAYSTLLPQPKNTAKNPETAFLSSSAISGFFSYFSECRPAYPISQLYISSYCFAEFAQEKSCAIARSIILFHSRFLS